MKAITPILVIALLLTSKLGHAAADETPFQKAMVRCQVYDSWELLTVGIIGDMFFGPKNGKLTPKARASAKCILAWTRSNEPKAMLKFGGVNARKVGG